MIDGFVAFVLAAVLVAIAAVLAVIVVQAYNAPPCLRYESRMMLMPISTGKVTVLTPMRTDVCVERKTQ